MMSPATLNNLSGVIDVDRGASFCSNPVSYPGNPTAKSCRGRIWNYDIVQYYAYPDDKGRKKIVVVVGASFADANIGDTIDQASPGWAILSQLQHLFCRQICPTGLSLVGVYMITDFFSGPGNANDRLMFVCATLTFTWNSILVRLDAIIAM